MSRMLMVRCGIALACTCALVIAVLPQSAGASTRIRECGDIAAEFAYNITSRAVSCRKARRVVRAWNGRGNVTIRGLACRYRDIGHEAGDIRCTGSRGRVVRWQTGV